MTSGTLRWQQTAKDREILAALDVCPLQVADILQISETFAEPFPSLDRVYKTMHRLVAALQVCSWRYATTGHRYLIKLICVNANAQPRNG